MRFATVDEGFVVQTSPAAEGASVAVGPRTVVLPGGDLLCSYMLTISLTVNDFVPMLARSTDLGATWDVQGPVWDHLKKEWSIFSSISRDEEGHLKLFGVRWPIDVPGESFWSEANHGMKQNDLIWARSVDGGRTWTDPEVIPMPTTGAAEAPGAICTTRGGRWLAPYAPYNTLDPNLRVERNQVIVMYSDDRGGSWNHSTMLRFDEPASGGAEAWLVELSDGRLLGTCWHVSHGAGGPFPNAYALSHDGGLTWQPTRSTGILGQSTALAAFPDGAAPLAYNQRTHGEPGVWLALVRPTDAQFGLEANEIVWRAEAPTQKQTSGEHDQWNDFSFGEPSVTLLPEGSLLVALWTVEPTAGGIRYVKLTMTD